MKNMKITFVYGANFIPVIVDDPKKEHAGCLIIDSPSRRIMLGLDHPTKDQQNNYMPYCVRSCDLQKLIDFRDQLNILIDSEKDKE